MVPFAAKRKRCLMFYDAFCVFVVVFLNIIFYLLMRILSNGGMDFRQIFTNTRLCCVILYWWYPNDNRFPKNLWGQNFHFL